VRIGDLARETDTRVETIRWYEKAGLLPQPARSSGNYRVYGQAELGRLSFIRRARDLGFSLDQVRALLELASNKEGACDSVHENARTHIAAIDRKITDLSALRQELSKMSAACERGRVAECRILDVLAPAVSSIGRDRAAKGLVDG
jgi:DNA-binding transcriptional MerR regulator